MREWESDFHRWGERPQPEMRPFFYTRLQARLAQSVETAEWLPWWLRRPAYAYSALLLLVLLCLWVVKLVLGLRTGLPSRRTRSA